MRWSLNRMMEELRDQQPGGSLVAQQFGYMMLVQALRLHLAEGLSAGIGWPLRTRRSTNERSHRRHARSPRASLDLQELAARAARRDPSSPSSSNRTVGSSPMEYLTRWRMLLAGDRLANSSDPISTSPFPSATNPKAPSAPPSKEKNGLFSPPIHPRLQTRSDVPLGKSNPHRTTRTRRSLIRAPGAIRLQTAFAANPQAPEPPAVSRTAAARKQARPSRTDPSAISRSTPSDSSVVRKIAAAAASAGISSR